MNEQGGFSNQTFELEDESAYGAQKVSMLNTVGP